MKTLLLIITITLMTGCAPLLHHNLNKFAEKQGWETDQYNPYAIEGRTINLRYRKAINRIR